MTAFASHTVDTPGELIELYRRDAHLHIYALADLEEPYWSRSTWWRRGDAAVGLVGLDEHTDVLCAVSTADPDGTLALIAEVAHKIPPCLVTGPVGIAKVFEDTGRRLRWHRRYNRFHLTHREAVPPRGADVVDLGEGDCDAALALYAHEPDAAFFVPAMLGDDTFVGVRAITDGSLVAIAGTHVVSEANAAAALGAVYVRPDHSGQGLGAAVTAGVIERLSGRFATIGLNCTEHNTHARAIYRQLGFTEALEYEECEIAD